MDLKHLLSGEIELNLDRNHSLEDSELKELIHKYPQEFFDTIILIQKTKESPQYVELPDCKKPLKFVLKKNKIQIFFSEDVMEENHVKFKALLGQIYEDLIDESYKEIMLKRKLRSDKNYSPNVEDINDMLDRL